MKIVKTTAVLLVLAILADAVLFGLVWAHHEFISGLNPVLNEIILLLFLLVAVLAAIFFFKRMAKFVGGMVKFNLAKVFVLGFLIFLIAAFFNLRGFSLSTVIIHLLDTYYVIGRVHLTAYFALLFLVFSVIYLIYPRITARSMNTPMAYIHFGATLLSGWFLCLRLSFPYEGLAGMPRRYLDYRAWSNFNTFGQLNAFQTWAVILLVFAQLIFLINLIYSAFNGPTAEERLP
jgi:cytochrome c oxidase subunit I